MSFLRSFIFEKNIFNGHSSSDPKVLSVTCISLLQFDNRVSSGFMLKLEMQWFEQGKNP